MSDRATLLALAERVEKAPDADENLDREIGEAVGFSSLLGTPPPYTHGVDAALTLLYADGGGLLLHLSDIGADGMACASVVRDTSCNPIVEHRAHGRFLPLALTAAALRARAASMCNFCTHSDGEAGREIDL